MEMTKFQSELVILSAVKIPLIGAWKSNSSLINGLLNPSGFSFPTINILSNNLSDKIYHCYKKDDDQISVFLEDYAYYGLYLFLYTKSIMIKLHCQNV